MLESISTTFYNISSIHYILDYSIISIHTIVYNDRLLIFVKIIKAMSRNMTIVVIVID